MRWLNGRSEMTQALTPRYGSLRLAGESRTWPSALTKRKNLFALERQGARRTRRRRLRGAWCGAVREGKKLLRLGQRPSEARVSSPEKATDIPCVRRGSPRKDDFRAGQSRAPGAGATTDLPASTESAAQPGQATQTLSRGHFFGSGYRHTRLDFFSRDHAADAAAPDARSHCACRRICRQGGGGGGSRHEAFALARRPGPGFGQSGEFGKPTIGGGREPIRREIAPGFFELEPSPWIGVRSSARHTPSILS